jgi:hypothetical protein
MKQRCTNPNSKDWKYYGARGITVWPPWMEDFHLWLEHVGRRPSSKHSLDRIDNDGHYVPGNVRWATALQQTHNRRVSKVK